MTDHRPGWRDPFHLVHEIGAGGDPRLAPPERTVGPDQDAPEVVAQIRADYRDMVARTGRPKPTTTRVEPHTAWRLAVSGATSPRALGYTDLDEIAAAAGYDPEHPDGLDGGTAPPWPDSDPALEAVAEWQCPTTTEGEPE